MEASSFQEKLQKTRRARNVPVFFFSDKRYPGRIRHPDLIMNAVEWLESKYSVKCPDVKFYPTDVPENPVGNHLDGLLTDDYDEVHNLIRNEIHISIREHLRRYPYPASYVWMIDTLFHEFHHWLEMKKGSARTSFFDYPLHSLVGRRVEANHLPAHMSEEEKRVEIKAQHDFMQFQETQPTLHRWVLLHQKAQTIG